MKPLEEATDVNRKDLMAENDKSFKLTYRANGVRSTSSMPESRL